MCQSEFKEMEMHLVSFAVGDEYYHEAGRNLLARAESLGIPADVRFLSARDFGVASNIRVPWHKICLYKSEFFQEMMSLHGAILWIDVDTTLISAPSALGPEVDFAGFTRSTGDIRTFDPYRFTRFWSPSYVYFGDTERGREFCNLIGDIARDAPSDVTDDWVLQEAWNASKPLQVEIFSSDRKVRSLASVTDRTWFLHGDSGNVSENISKVRQHPPLMSGAEVVVDLAEKYWNAGNVENATQLSDIAADLGNDSRRLVTLRSSIYRQKKMPSQADRLILDYCARNRDDKSAQLLAARIHERRMDWIAAFAILERVAAEDNDIEAAHAQSILFDVQLEEKAWSDGLVADDRPPLWWMKAPYPGNLGDILNPYVVEKVTGRPPRFVSRGQGILAIGSTIRFAQKGTMVWGTGCSRRSQVLCPDANYAAVRGPITLQLLKQAGVVELPEVMGDPALLLPRWYNPTVEKAYKLGIIDHVTFDNPTAPVQPISDDVLRISLARVGYAEIEKFIDELLSCEKIISSSLHGIIIAAAYGIPVQYATRSRSMRGISGDGMKFEDFFLSIGEKVQTAIDLDDYSEITLALAEKVPTDPFDVNVDLDSLVEVFPWKPKN